MYGDVIYVVTGRRGDNLDHKAVKWLCRAGAHDGWELTSREQRRARQQIGRNKKTVDDVVESADMGIVQ